MTREMLKNKCRGSLIGGAVGDALGYAVEFMSLNNILRKYGKSGIREYELDRSGLARFSDDTQMSLFTAEGLLNAHIDDNDDIRTIDSIKNSYLVWYATQTKRPFPIAGHWLSNIEPLWIKRAPGRTCMMSLRNLQHHAPSNDSKGCGGIMRVAPVGIFGASHQDVMDSYKIAWAAGESAKLTHCHPLSTYSSMVLALIVAECIRSENIDRDIFKEIITDRTFRTIRDQYDDNAIAELEALIDKAICLAESDITDFDAIRELGEGWVAEETLAISVFSVMRYIDDFEKCIVCAVNHDGDSDSTGAVTGNIIGAIIGYEYIPDKYKHNLEIHDLIVSIADDLGGFSSSMQIEKRYNQACPYGVTNEIVLKFPTSER